MKQAMRITAVAVAAVAFSGEVRSEERPERAGRAGPAGLGPPRPG